MQFMYKPQHMLWLILIKQMENKQNEVGEFMELYLDMIKGRLNTSKLVRKPVQVRGKDGKVYTRMQWVDPNTGKPVSEGSSSVELHNDSDKKKKPSTQKEHIDHHVKKMSKEEKYFHINKHKLDWKRNEHESIDHKNAVMALKQHFYDNPHLLGAEHLPKEDENRTPEGDDKINDAINSIKNDSDKLYDIMRKLGVVDKDDVDPRTVDEYKKKEDGGNGMGPIRHMRNMMKLKKHLVDNPDALEGLGIDTKPKPKPTKKQTPAQKGGNTIKGILDSMSREDKYALCKKHGIADMDPLHDPDIEDKMKPIVNMRNMMKLKSAIERDPSILNLNKEDIDEPIKAKDVSGVKDMSEYLKEISRDLKLKWADDLADHDTMKNRIQSAHDHVDNMHKISSLAKILAEDKDLFNKFQKEAEKDKLLNMKIGNKKMGKILRGLVGLKGIGDIMAGEGDEKGKEWEFGESSFARIEEDDEGEPVLSVVDTGKDGEEWNEIAIHMSKVKEFMDTKMNAPKPKGKPIEPAPAPKPSPIHKLPINKMWERLNDNPEEYSDKIRETIGRDLHTMWEKSGFSSDIKNIAGSSGHYVSSKAFKSVLNAEGVNLSKGTNVDVNSNEWKSMVYNHLIEGKKTKNATDYLVKNPTTMEKDTYVLHESAKKWSHNERLDARKDLTKNALHVDITNFDADMKKPLMNTMHNHLTHATSHIPFDLFSDLMASGLRLQFVDAKSRERTTGEKHDSDLFIGNHFSDADNVIALSEMYMHDTQGITKANNSFNYKPERRNVRIGSTRYSVGQSALSDVVAHEFAHALDHYMSGSKGFLDWGSNDIGKKYSMGHHDLVHDSYTKSVERSNPDKELAATSGGGGSAYLWHLDEWMSSYEGRIYDRNYYDPSSGHVKQQGSKFIDNSWGMDTNSKYKHGLEHWSENVSRFANAKHAYKQWKQKTGNDETSMEDWAKDSHKAFIDAGYGDDYQNSSNTSYMKAPHEERINSAGYLYHRMTQSHPELLEGIKKIFDRPDFIDQVKKSEDRGDIGESFYIQR